MSAAYDTWLTQPEVERRKELIRANQRALEALWREHGPKLVEPPPPPPPPRPKAPRKKRKRGLSKRPSARAIIRFVADRHGLGVDDLLAKTNRRAIVAIRMEAIREIRERRPDLPVAQIGREFGMHHTTVLHHLGRLGRKR
jgi:DNA-binding transcriptional ArsR family regulator